MPGGGPYQYQSKAKGSKYYPCTYVPMECMLCANAGVGEGGKWYVWSC